jgi:hypothetical protein
VAGCQFAFKYSLQIHGRWPFRYKVEHHYIIFCQVSSLDDVKTANQGDNNAAKTIALDHLGVIAARIRSSALCIKTEPSDIGRTGSVSTLKPLEEVRW